MRFVWKQNACLGRRSGMMDRDQAVYLSCSSLSSSVFSCSDGSSAGICNNKRVPASTLLLTFSLPVFFPCWKILQDWKSYLRMYKDEWTYLLEHKCPNMWLEDHKSAIVNLGETAPHLQDLSVSRQRPAYTREIELKFITFFYFSLERIIKIIVSKKC